MLAACDDNANDQNKMITRIAANDYNDNTNDTDGNRNRMTMTMIILNDDKNHLKPWYAWY